MTPADHHSLRRGGGGGGAGDGTCCLSGQVALIGRLVARAADVFDGDDDGRSVAVGVSPFLPRKNSMKYFYISCTHCGAHRQQATVVCVCVRYTRFTHTHRDTRTHFFPSSVREMYTQTGARDTALSLSFSLFFLLLTHYIATILLVHCWLVGWRTCDQETF